MKVDKRIQVCHPDFGVGWADSMTEDTTMVQFDDWSVGAWQGWRLVATETVELLFETVLSSLDKHLTIKSLTFRLRSDKL